MSKKLKKLIKKHEIVVQPFGISCMVALGQDEFDQMLALFDGLEPEHFTDMHSAPGYVQVMVDDEGCSHFLMKLTPERIEEIVWHEALHLAIFILEYAGVKTSPKNHEVLCYMQGHIVNEIDRRIYGRKDK